MSAEPRSFVRVAIWNFKTLVLDLARSKPADYLAALFLKCRFRLWHVSVRQVPAYVALLELDRAARRIRATYFLDAGTLLGAVRQGAFAGRPSDVDVTFPIRDEATHVIHSLVQTPHFANFKTLQERTQIYYQPISNFGGRLGNPVLCDVSHGSECFCPPHDPLDTSNKRAMTADVFCRPFPICPCYEQRLESLYGFEWKIPSSTQVAERESKIRVYGD